MVEERKGGYVNVAFFMSLTISYYLPKLLVISRKTVLLVCFVLVKYNEHMILLQYLINRYMCVCVCDDDLRYNTI